MIEISRKLLSQQKIPKFFISNGCHLASGNSEFKNSLDFLKELNKIFQMYLKYFAQNVTDFLLLLAKNTKNEPFLTL